MNDDYFTIHSLLRKYECFNTLHRFEREIGLFFDRTYVSDLIEKGKILKVIKYIEGFINIPDNVIIDKNNKNINPQQVALKIFHDLHVQRYLEAIFHEERYEAFQILQTDLCYLLQNSNFEHYKDLVDLLSSKQLPEDVINNFVSSRDSINWKNHAKNFFIPHIFSIIDKHTTILKIEKEFENLRDNNVDINEIDLRNDNNSEYMDTDNNKIIINNNIDDIIDDNKHNIIKVQNNAQSLNKPTKLSEFWELKDDNSNGANHMDVENIKFFQFNDFSENPISRLVISNDNVLASLDNKGKIYIFQIDMDNINNSRQRHKGYNRYNIFPEKKISSSIDISENGQWICTTSGGAGSLYKISEREQRRPISDILSSMSFVCFDVSEPEALLFGLHNGKVKIHKGDTLQKEFQFLDSQIIYLTKKQNILAGIDKRGVARICFLQQELIEIHSENLPKWKRDSHTSAVIHISDKNEEQVILICHKSEFILHNLTAGKTFREPAPKSYNFMGAIFSENSIIVITSNKYAIIYEYKNNIAVLSKSIPLNKLKGYPTCITSRNNTLFIGDSKGVVSVIKINNHNL